MLLLRSKMNSIHIVSHISDMHIELILYVSNTCFGSIQYRLDMLKNSSKMLTVLLAIFGSYMRVQEFCRDLYVNSFWLEIVSKCHKGLHLRYWKSFWIHCCRGWNTGLDLKLKFTMLSITYLKKEGQQKTFLKN